MERQGASEAYARRTGRFRQLVDPRSRVNGLLLTGSPGFREVGLEERRNLAGSSHVRALTPSPAFLGAHDERELRTTPDVAHRGRPNSAYSALACW
jgi:hypothetical protein